uniref:Protein kinase domain-containing protein n=1 Tax=Chenopodium quinoa TaxID=63459 RepID=A0A803LVC8_CHEQI
MKMEGSSDTGWRKSASSRGLDTSASSERNLRLLHESRRSLSTDASRNSVLVAMDPVVHSIEWGDVSLRRWLDNPERSIDAIESLHIFRQIVEIVSTAHSQGIVVNNVRPSCFIMSSFNHVSFIESASCSDSGSDSLEDGLDGQDTESKQPCSSLCNDDLNEQRSGSSYRESQLIPDTIGSKSQTIQATNPFSVEEKGWCETKDTKGYRKAGEKRSFPMKELLLMESGWYTSPEEIAGAPCSCASDIYRLGVLLFELFCTFSSIEEKSGTMSSLRHRVLPPQLLLKWPKEASFCLWLLHPDPCSRPKMGDLLQSEFLNEPRDNLNEREAAIELREKIEEHELLLEFLVRMRQAKQDAASKLQNTVSFLSSDIEEIVNKQKALKEKGGTFSGSERIRQSAPDLIPIKSVEHDATDHNRQEIQIHDAVKFSSVESESHNQENLLSKNSRLIQNFKKLESAYLSTRHRPARLSGKPVGGHSQLSSNSRGSVVSSVSLAKEQRSNNGESGWISPFLEGLCKYLSFTKLNVKADLKQGDLLNSSNLVCSVGFDRDGEFFATAGVNKKIKVFECDAILNGNRDIHYPVTEMACRSKLSSICWNSYIKSQIASSNFEGVVQVWDAARSQVFVELKEHERRVWSVDFSSADPTLLASGSDDGSVKLWSINQAILLLHLVAVSFDTKCTGASIGTIKTKANVCCVQFPIDSGRSLAFGSADHKIYYYDLRSPRVPLCTLIGHNKTVSYIKFVDSNTLVSASTDNTLKLWDLSLCASRVVEGPLQSFTGHTNMKNFVGLSVSDGYIATGSETNEVFIYHKAFPMPALSYKFSSLDPLSGNETEDAAQFISSVCWRGQSSTLVAANSTGDVKLLEMV